MAHTKKEDLLDLSEELGKIRALAGVIEKSAGIFYLKSKPFLHFHDKAGVRWAHVKIDHEWVELEIGFSVSEKEKTHFLKKVIEAHANF